MPNYDGEYELRIFYITVPTGEDPMEHVFTIDVKVIPGVLPGTDFQDIGVTLKNMTESTLDVETDALVALLAPFWNTTTSILRAELWHAPEASHNFQFIAVYTIGLLGTSASPTQAASQATITLRSAGGGIMRVQLMEVMTMNNSVDPFPFVAPAQALALYLIGNITPFVARDNTFPVAANRYSQTQNERLYRKRYRNN